MLCAVLSSGVVVCLSVRSCTTLAVRSNTQTHIPGQVILLTLFRASNHPMLVHAHLCASVHCLYNCLIVMIAVIAWLLLISYILSLPPPPNSIANFWGSTGR